MQNWEKSQSYKSKVHYHLFGIDDLKDKIQPRQNCICEDECSTTSHRMFSLRTTELFLHVHTVLHSRQSVTNKMRRETVDISLQNNHENDFI